MAGPLLGLAKAYLGSKARDYATSKLENAIGLPKDSISVATNPAGFAKNIAKDLTKDYVKSSFTGREAVPVEDRTPTPVGGGGGGGGTPTEDIGLEDDYDYAGMKRGGKVKPKAKSASRRGDGIAQRGKTKGRYL